MFGTFSLNELLTGCGYWLLVSGTVSGPVRSKIALTCEKCHRKTNQNLI